MIDTPKQLANLARIGKLIAEQGTADEIAGLLKSGNERLTDARVQSLALSSRFDLAYNSAHAFSLAALRWHGYRSDSRYLVFQTLTHTLTVSDDVWRVLSKAHDLRNVAEYEGHFDVDTVLLGNLIKAVEVVQKAVTALPPMVAKGK